MSLRKTSKDSRDGKNGKKIYIFKWEENLYIYQNKNLYASLS